MFEEILKSRCGSGTEYQNKFRQYESVREELSILSGTGNSKWCEMADGEEAKHITIEATLPDGDSRLSGI